MNHNKTLNEIFNPIFVPYVTEEYIKCLQWLKKGKNNMHKLNDIIPTRQEVTKLRIEIIRRLNPEMKNLDLRTIVNEALYLLIKTLE